jgi:putative flippase GtrA
MRTSIVIPMWNEESWVEHAYNEVNKAIQKYNLDAQIVFATDGCTDRTVEIIQELQKKDPSLILFNDPNRLGRGLALKRVFAGIDTPFVVYMDTDLATDLQHLPQLISYLEKGADIVTGSRLMKESECVRSQKRNTFSLVYNFLARFLFRSKIKDHQCGFKGFNRKAIMKTLHKVRSNGWFWDTEILIRGQKNGLNIVEFPVRWTDRAEEASKVNVWKDAKNMGTELALLRIQLFPKGILQMMSFAAIGVSNTTISLVVLWILENTIGRGNWGYAFAYAVGIVNSFVLNRRFTFEERGVSGRTFGQFASFVVLNVIALIAYSEIATFLEQSLGVFYLWSALITTLMIFVFTFLVSKLAIFRREEKQ